VTLPGELATRLLPDPPDAAQLVHHRRRPWGRREVVVERFGPDGRSLGPGDPRAGEALLEALDAGAVLSVPFRYHASAVGRLHVVRREPRPFDRGEVEFTRLVLEQVVPVLENLRLVDRMASDAADEERRRIARDLHDSVIQPYLGLRLGLSAARAALAAGRQQEGEAQLGRLAELTDGEIETLRGYVRALRGGEAGAEGGLLDVGLRRFCSRFSEATGIHVEVWIEGTPPRNDRLAAELFQLVAEALSNVRRHTAATQVEVRLQTGPERVVLSVSNDAARPGDPDFTPRSLAERTAALGGTLQVEHPAATTTRVEISIPL
jgi:signal transduction histidine kinase